MSTVAEIFQTMSYGPAPEAAGPALAWLSGHHNRFDLFIDNRWTPPQPNGKDASPYFESTNPATAKPLAQIAQAGAADVDAAVRAARAALPGWRALPGHARARYLYALARQVQKHARLLAVLETLDNGKPIRESRDIDIPLVARHFAYHTGWAQLMHEELPGYEPVGVVGQIIPWNFPLLMLAWKIAPALAMGNTVVLKPAEFTSLSALRFAEIMAEVGLPPGVVNIVTGDGRTGELLVKHPDVDKIAFTGSTEVGRLIRRATAGTGKRISLELGGKSPFLVFDDADLDSVVEGVVDAIWFNQGEVCCAGSRLLVQEDVAEELIARLQARMERLRMGDPMDKAMDIGAIVAPVQLERIRRLVDQGVAEGAKMWQPSWSLPREGYFFPPTLFTGVAPASTIAQVEIFGPVLVTMTFRSPAEAVALANNTAFGLAASIWSENINLALDVARKVKAGSVWINSTNLFDAASGFGGYRESGYGREGGPEGLWEYIRRSPVAAAVPAAGKPGNGTFASRWPRRAASGPTVARVAQTETDAGSAPVATQAVAEDVTEAFRSGANGQHLGLARLNAEESAAVGSNGAAPGGPASAPLAPNIHETLSSPDGIPAIDRTAKLYIGGKQARPDSGYSLPVLGHDGRLLGEVGEGNRKDIRNAVEAAATATGWAASTAYNRAQVLYYLAENLSGRAAEFAARLVAATAIGAEEAAAEVEASIERLFTYAAWADKYDGRVAQTPIRGLTIAIPEPIGVLGIVCPDERPLLSLLSLLAPAIAMGNTVVVVPSERHPLTATDLYQVLDTSDVPAGVVNIVTGPRESLALILAAHDNVDALWYHGTEQGAGAVEMASAGNLKRTWTHGTPVDWRDPTTGAGEEFLRQATQVKNIWAPYGE